MYDEQYAKIGEMYKSQYPQATNSTIVEDEFLM